MTRKLSLIYIAAILMVPAMQLYATTGQFELGMTKEQVLEITTPLDTFSMEVEGSTGDIFFIEDPELVLTLENEEVTEIYSHYDFMKTTTESFVGMVNAFISMGEYSSDEDPITYNESHSEETNYLREIKPNFDITIRDAGIFSSYDSDKNVGYKLKVKNRSEYPITDFELTAYFYDQNYQVFFEHVTKPMNSYSYNGPDVLKPNYSILIPAEQEYYTTVKGMDLNEWEIGSIDVELTDVTVDSESK